MDYYKGVNETIYIPEHAFNKCNKIMSHAENRVAKKWQFNPCNS